MSGRYLRYKRWLCGESWIREIRPKKSAANARIGKRWLICKLVAEEMAKDANCGGWIPRRRLIKIDERLELRIGRTRERTTSHRTERLEIYLA